VRASTRTAVPIASTTHPSVNSAIASTPSVSSVHKSITRVLLD